MQELRFTIIITEKCNLACKYCYVPHTQGLKTMPMQIVDDMFTYIERIMNQYDIYFDIFGGEPLVAWEQTKTIIDKVEALNKKYSKDMRVTVFSNFTLMTEDKLAYLVQKPFVRFNFSVDGHKQAHDSARVFPDGTGSFDTVMKNIELFKKYYPKYQPIFKAVISPDNIEFIMDSAIKLNEMGYKRISFGYARDDIWTEESLDKYKKYMKKLANYFIEHIDDGIWYDIFAIPILDSQSNKKQRKYCSAGRGTIAVTPEGDIYPCQRFYNNRSPYKIGDIWSGIDYNSKWYNLFTKSTLDNYIGCKNCSAFPHYSCPGQCMAAQYESSGNIFLPIKNVCELIKINAELSFEIYEKLKDNINYQKILDHKKYGG